MTIAASGHKVAMGEDDERESNEEEAREAAVLPAHEAVSIITAGREADEPEGRSEEPPARETSSDVSSG